MEDCNSTSPVVTYSYNIKNNNKKRVKKSHSVNVQNSWFLYIFLANLLNINISQLTKNMYKNQEFCTHRVVFLNLFSNTMLYII